MGEGGFLVAESREGRDLLFVFFFLKKKMDTKNQKKKKLQVLHTNQCNLKHSRKGMIS